MISIILESVWTLRLGPLELLKDPPSQSKAPAPARVSPLLLQGLAEVPPLVKRFALRPARGSALLGRHTVTTSDKERERERERQRERERENK